MRKINIEPGEFPFRLVDGPRESRYLTWVRNHSNYLARRGFVDYMRIVAVLVRGILINFATLLPHLLVVGVVSAFLYGEVIRDWEDQLDAERAQAKAAAQEAASDRGKEVLDEGEVFVAREFFLVRPVSDKSSSWVRWVQDKTGTRAPYVLTPIVVLASVAYYLLFPIVIRLFKVLSHKRTLQSGRESSVKQRDFYERTFGGCLIAVLVAVAIETLPLLMHYFHEFEDGDLRASLSAIVGGSSIAVLSGAGKLMSKLGPAKRKIAVAVIAVVGLLLPLLVVLHVSEYAVFGQAMDSDVQRYVMLTIPGLLVAGALLALAFGWRNVSRKELRWLTWLLLGVAAAAALLYFVAPWIDAPWKFLLVMALEIWGFCWLAVDVNLTAVLGLYRDRLAAAYLVGEDTGGDVDIEEDIDLHDLCLHEALSVAPYHLINAAHNLQASRDISIRERNSDFFIFSKRFVGGARTGYCRSESLEKVFPQMDLATAMAISAAAAAPNMGANTSRATVALLTLLNVRLGYWIPNPGLLSGALAEHDLKLKDPKERAESLARWASALPGVAAQDLPAIEERLRRMVDAAELPAAKRLGNGNLGFSFSEVFAEELEEVKARWANAYAEPSKVREPIRSTRPSPDNGLVGLAFSGGGIRSATLNMGIVQALERAGVFDHADYISSVSGGGYFGSSVSTLMRAKTRLHSEVSGTTDVARDGEYVTITVTGETTRSYRFREGVTLSPEVEAGRVEAGDPLTTHFVERAGLPQRFAWRVRPAALRKEMVSQVDEVSEWVNLSDGGHLENLATFELLRRRCRFIIVGDGAADPLMYFKNLATLLRYARIDLGIEIDIDLDDLRLRDPAARLLREGEDPLDVSTPTQRPLNSLRHFAIGKIYYPKPDGGREETPGHLLYFKSSCTGDEEEIIQQYRNTHPSFPHESTADQFFDEGQFEAYRALGQHMGEKALEYAPNGGEDRFDAWFGEGRTVSDYFAAWFTAMAPALAHRWADDGDEAAAG